MCLLKRMRSKLIYEEKFYVTMILPQKKLYKIVLKFISWQVMLTSKVAIERVVDAAAMHMKLHICRTFHKYDSLEQTPEDSSIV